MMQLDPEQAVEAETDSFVRYGSKVYTCWAPATLISTDGETSIIRFRGLLDSETTFQWPTNRLRPAPPTSMTEIGQCSLSHGDVVDYYRLGHYFLALVLANPTAASGTNIILQATTEVIYNAPTTRLRRSIVFDTDKPSAECWAPMPRPSLLSQMIYKAGTTTPCTISARPLPFNKRKSIHSQCVPPAHVEVPAHLKGPVDWDLELPGFESRFGKLLETSPGASAASAKIPTSHLALIASFMQDRAKALSRQQSVQCSLKDELDLIATHLGLPPETTDIITSITYTEKKTSTKRSPAAVKRKFDAVSSGEMAGGGDGSDGRAAEGRELHKAGSTMQRLA